MATRPITAGPSKLDLMFSLFEGKHIKLTVDGKEVEVGVLQVQAEDGSRESWNLAGYIVGTLPSQCFRAYFSTRRRKGHLEVIG